MSSLLNLVLLLPHHWASATPGASSVHLSKWKMDSWAQPETWSLHANKRLFRRGKKKYGEFIIFICLCNIFGYIFGSQSFGEHCKKLINLNKRLTLTCFGSGFLSRRIIIWQLTTSYSETGDFEERRYLYRVAVTSDHFNSQFFTNQKLRIARDSLLRTISLLCSQMSKFTKMKSCFLNLKKKFRSTPFYGCATVLSFSDISSSEQQEIASIFLMLPESGKLDIYYSHYAICKLKD